MTDIKTIAHDGKQLVKLVNTTINSYKKLAARLHETAGAVFLHAAQYGEASAMNKFYAGLRVNDQTAFRVWVGEHSSFVDIGNGAVRHWIKFSAKDGFTMVKGVEAHRKDMFVIGEDADGKDDVLSWKPFYEKDVKDKDSITLEALIKMLEKAATSVTKKAADEGISLPADVLLLTTSIKNTTAKELAAIARIATE
jgi:hypothetical protein